jgi:probable rRNA maturation factor
MAEQRQRVHESTGSTTARAVSIANRHPRLRLNRRSVARAIAMLDGNPSAIGLAPSAVPRGELSIVFLTDRELARLHAEFLADPSTTDVITFEGNPLLESAGEICVSADTAAAYARSHDHDFSTELTLYLVHGWLHLAGHDDLQPLKKRAMRRAEARAMRVLQEAEAVPAFALRAGKQHSTSRMGGPVK